MKTTLAIVRTEYSFGNVYGQLDKVIEACADYSHILINDRNTWGHVPFFAEVKKAGKIPLLGVEIGVVEDVFTNKERTPEMWVTLVARNNDGLRDLYQLVKTSYEFFHYQPRIGLTDLEGVSGNLWVLANVSPILTKVRKVKTLRLIASPSSIRIAAPTAQKMGLRAIPALDNYYPKPEHRKPYEILTRFPEDKTTPMSILTPEQLKQALPGLPEESYTKGWGEICEGAEKVELPKAENIRFNSKKTLEQLCKEGAKRIGINLAKDKVYSNRLSHELKLIREKNFEDYFFVIADLCTAAKKVMLVGPARGSSAGSLACYLLGITEVDPIVHKTMFERFIDVTRSDMPDIDIDFPDKEWVFKYLSDKYGYENVARIGTVLTYQAKSAITDVGKALKIPDWELRDVKDAIIERSGGDARAAFCIKDTFESLDIGKALLKKYPSMVIASDLEAHAKSSGIHAAGIVVCNEPVSNYCGVTDKQVACIDKKDAEKINLLKIDALGLRTLLILDDVLQQIGKSRDWLYRLDLHDQAAFDLITAGRFSGIFQFEGFALKALTKQMGVREFNDIVSITSLARPGPLHCGAAGDYVLRRTGQAEVTHIHPSLEPYTRDTLGVIIYQEQVITISREIGDLDWADTNALRRAMSKSMGEEFFNKYKEKFMAGAKKRKIKDQDADAIWKTMMTFGSWAFNLSHGVAYGIISYWCAYLKAHFPLEFAAATLRNLKDEDQAVKMLRELVKEGFEYIPFDPLKSQLNWSVQDGKLVGGWLGVKGVGEKKAVVLMEKIKNQSKLTEAESKMVYSPQVLWQDIFEAERRWGDWYKDHELANASQPLSYIVDLNSDGEYIVLGKLKEKNIRDMNEYQSLVKRGGKKVEHNNLWLNMSIEDDTDSILATIQRGLYEELGKPIVESGKIGDWYLFRGKLQGGWRKLIVSKVRKLT